MPHRRFGIALGVFFVCSYRTVSAPYPSPIAEYRRALLVTEEPSPWVIIDDAPSRRRTYRPDTPPSPSPLSQQTHSQTAALPATEPDAVATRGLRRKSLPSDWMTQPAAYDPVVPSTKGVFDQVQIPSSNLSSHQVDSLRSSIAYDDFSVSLEPDQTSMTRAKMSRVALRSGGEQEKGSLNQQVFGLMASEEDPGVSTEVMKENQDETTSDTSERERAEVRDCPALEIPCPSSGATLRHDGSALPSTNSGNRVAPPSPHLRHDSIGSHWEMRSAAHENWLESRRMFLRPASPPGSTTSVLPMFSAENGLYCADGAAPARDLRNQDQAEVGGKAMTPSSAPLIRVYDYAFNAESPAIEAIDIAKPEIDSPPHISKHRASTYKSLRRTVSATRSYGALSFDHRCLERRAASLAKSTTYLSDTQSTQAGPRYLNERTETGTGMTSDCVQFADVDAEAEIAPEQSLEERHPPSSCGQDEPVYSNFNTSSSLSTATFIAIPRRSSSSASAETQKQTKIPVYLEKQVQTDPLLPEAPRVPSIPAMTLPWSLARTLVQIQTPLRTRSQPLKSFEVSRNHSRR
ncbi:hypothetical protein BD324DRAFT_610678 [Kockovaella imperatae]|uniref:Uncharacterized protein n=1 Tax=Kockovaella imperatae TaxID=4999 RepID=A0A1Y1U728_9TREE|nr:hypothetical protein BD324DRAFT_610678 [Kockovaella imperatae]ORX33344.1 hypothetical protein BD324DRAFT_610678 [Kockovaella imperatae]